ncbi:hypothetical protein THIAE_06160 [Thiomicrospira aerophila AL3]|uniref:Integrating conjugative element protein n=1 Tax=Thiomicrospira aerophila AL3 TaxID=717772 RepID=W0DV33_9GAMM|nr:DUF1525 domain-containing protein [Thiomicrospira aerophila]AHF02297.1 hypothetical protein THIAE_06160 [Thiomicrospira aerophila AL3]
MLRWIILLLAIQPGLVIAQTVEKVTFFLKEPLVVSNKALANEIEINIIYLDDYAKIVQQINRNLPANEQEAERIALDLLSDPKTQSKLTASFEQDLNAYRLGIDRVPAAIVNDAFIIYGSADLAKILSIADEALSR